MRYLILLLALFTFAACGENGPSEAEVAAAAAAEVAQDRAYETMMEAHDRVMPMMGRITAAERAINLELQDENIAPERKDILTAAFEQLEDAGDGMMDWMGNVKTLEELRADMNDQAIVAYIKEQSTKIAGVEQDITTAVATATEVLGGTLDAHSHDGHDHGGHDHDHDHDHDHNH